MSSFSEDESAPYTKKIKIKYIDPPNYYWFLLDNTVRLPQKQPDLVLCLESLSRGLSSIDFFSSLVDVRNNLAQPTEIKLDLRGGLTFIQRKQIS